MQSDRNNPSQHDWQEALTIVAGALNNIKKFKYKYAIIGSGAYYIHGVIFRDPNYHPADIDINTSNIKATDKALMSLNQSKNVKVEKDTNSSRTVSKYQITLANGSKIAIDVTHNDDFGYRTATFQEINKVKTTSLMDTLLSIFTHPERRQKDFIAFKELIVQNIEMLRKELQQKKVKDSTFFKSLQHAIDALQAPHISRDEETVDAIISRTLASGPGKTQAKIESGANDHSQMLFSQPKNKSSPGRIDQCDLENLDALPDNNMKKK